MKILLAVDGSKHCLGAVQSVIEHAAWFRETPQVELATVHLPVPAVGASRAQARKYYQEEGEAALAASRKKLDAAGVRYTAHVLVGPIAETIVKHAKDSRCDLICIASRGRSAVAGALLGSTATKVLHLSPLPLLLVK